MVSFDISQYIYLLISISFANFFFFAFFSIVNYNYIIMTEIVSDEELQNTHVIWLLDNIQKKFVIFIPSIKFFLRGGYDR